MRFARCLGYTLFMLTLPSQAFAKLDLQIPVDCAIGTTCFIQNYMDHDQQEDAAHDYTCGSLTYDGHNGTDFRVPNYADLERGVNILAAADGEVVQAQHVPEIKNNDIPMLKLIKLGLHSNCGSMIRINHGIGWESIYCHLNPDSFTVKEGDNIKAGQVIARMGTSGNTQFPHLHYELRHYNNPVDPFVGYASADYDCSPQQRYSQWNNATTELLYYIPSGVVDAGFSNLLPTAEQAREGSAYVQRLDVSEPVIYFGVELYGVHPYDVLTIQLVAPDGATLAEKTVTYDKTLASAFEVLSVKREATLETWPAGRYAARVTVERFEHVIKETVVELEKPIEMVVK